MTNSADVIILQNHVRIGDPHATTDDADRLSIRSNIFEALVAPSGDGSFLPLLAESWSLTDDACTWQFQLRDDVHFHDGKQLDAVDVVRSLTRVRDETIRGELGTTGVISGYLKESRIREIGRHVVEVRTPSPMADLLDLLVDIPVLSDGAISALDRSELIGTGPYRVEDHTTETVQMSRADGWQRSSSFLPERLTWNAVAHDDERRDHLTRGEMTMVTGLDADGARAFEQDGSVTVLRTQTTVCATFMFNLMNGVATSRAVRRAINYAVDVDALIADIVGGEAIKISGPMTSLHLGYDPGVHGFAYDPVAARAELATLDFGDRIPITLDVPTVLPDEARDLAIFISEYLDAVGFDVEIAVYEDRPGYAEMVKSKQIHDAACFDSSPASTYRLLREKFHSGFAGPWWLGYTNLDVDRLIDRGARTADVAERRRIYRQAFRIISDDAAWLFLYNPYRLTAVSQLLSEKLTASDWTPAPGGILTFR